MRISDWSSDVCSSDLPNPNAQARDYIGGLNLTEAEFRLIKTDLSPESRRFLVKQGHDSVVVELDLAGLDDELAVLPGRSSTVALLDELRGAHVDDPKAWMPEFRRRWRKVVRGGWRIDRWWGKLEKG